VQISYWVWGRTFRGPVISKSATSQGSLQLFSLNHDRFAIWKPIRLPTFQLFRSSAVKLFHATSLSGSGKRETLGTKRLFRKTESVEKECIYLKNIALRGRFDYLRRKHSKCMLKIHCFEAWISDEIKRKLINVLLVAIY